MTPENRVLRAIASLSSADGKADGMAAALQEDITSRCFAVAEIASAGVIWRGKERDALRVLLTTIQHPDSRVSLSAGQAVATVAPRGDEETFRETSGLLSHKLEHVRFSALTALAGSAAYRDQAAVKHTTSMLQDSSLRIRRRAVVVLASLAPPSHPMLLRSICLYTNHPQPYVRAAATRAIGKVAEATDEIALGLLREMLRSDLDMSVRTQALESLVPFSMILRDIVAADSEKSSADGMQPVKTKKLDHEVDTLALAKVGFASNISAVLSAMQDSMGSADEAFVKRASASLRKMMGCADKGADMVQEPHREQEGYSGHKPRPHSGLRHALTTPDVLRYRQTELEEGGTLSPMGEYFEEDDWNEEDKDSSAWVILDGEVMLRNQVSPRSLERALPSPCPNRIDSPIGSPIRSVRRKSSKSMISAASSPLSGKGVLYTLPLGL